MNIRSKFYAILCVGVLLGTTGCYRDELASFQKQIDDFKKTSVDELDKRVKSVEEQIVQINQTIKDLEEVKKELQSKIDAATELIAELSKDVEKNSGDISILNNSVAQLKEQLEKIDGQIAGLKTYVNDELKNAKDWATATFATIDKMNEIAETVATIQTAMESIQETAARHDREIAGLKTDIAKVEENLKAWVNSQLEDYYNIAAVDAKLGELTENYTNADEALREDIRGEISTAKEEITAAYKKYVDDAIKGGGQIGEEIQRQINAFKAELEPRLKSMEDRLDGLEASIAKLEGRVKTLEEQVKDMKTTIGNLEYAYEQADKAIKSLQGIVDELKNTTIPGIEAKLKDYESRIKALEEYKAEIAQKIEDLKKYVDEQTADCLKKAKEYTEAWVKKSLENYNTKEEITKLLADLKTELSSLITAEENARKEADSALEKKLQEQIDALKKTVEELGKIEADLKKWVTDNYYDKSAIDAKLAELKKAYEAADSQLQKNIDAAKEELESTIAKKEEDITKAYQDAIKTAIEEAHGKITKEIADAIAGVTADVTALTKRVEALESTVKENSEAIKTLQATQKQIQDDITALKSKDGQFEQEIAALKDADKTINETIEKLRKDLATATADISSISSKVETLESSVAKLTQDLAAANASIESLKDDVKEIKKDASALEARVKALEDRMDTAENLIKDLKSVDEQLQLAIATLKEKDSSLESEIATLKKVDEEIKGTIKTITTDLASAKTDITTLKSDVSTLKSNVEKLTADLATANANIATLQSDVAGIKSAASALEARVSTLETQVAANANAIEKLKKVDEELQADIQALKEKDVVLSTKIDELIAADTQIKETIASLKAGLEAKDAELLSKIDALQSSVTQLTKDLAEANSKISQIETSIESITSAASALEARVKILEEKMEAAEAAIDALEISVATIETNLENLTNLVGTRPDTETRTVWACITALISQSSTLSDAIDAIKGEGYNGETLAGLKALADQINSALTTLTSRVDAFLGDDSTTTLASIVEQIGTINTTITSLQTSVQTNTNDIATIKGYLYGTGTKENPSKGSIYYQLDSLYNKILGDDTTSGTVLYRITTLEGQVSTLIEAIGTTGQTLDAKINKVKEDLEKRLNEIAGYKDKEGTAVSVLEDIFADISTRLADIEKAIAELKKADETINTAIKALQDMIGKKGDDATKETLWGYIAALIAADNDIKTLIDTKIGDLRGDYTTGTLSDLISQLQTYANNAVSTAITALKGGADDTVTLKYLLDQITGITSKTGDIWTAILANQTNISTNSSAITTINTYLGDATSPAEGTVRYQLKDLYAQLGSASDDKTKNTIYGKIAANLAAIELLQAALAKDGDVDQRIAAAKKELTDRLDKISYKDGTDTIENIIADIDDRLDALEADVESLKGRINSMVAVPDYEDGSVKVSFGYESNAIVKPETFMVNYKVSPSEYAATIAKDTKNLAAYIVQTQTKAGGLSDLEIKECSASSGILTVTFNASGLPDNFFGFDGDYQACNLALSVLESEKDIYTTKFVPLYPCCSVDQELAISIYSESSSGNLRWYKHSSDYYNYKRLKVTTNGIPGKWSVKSYPDWLEIEVDKYVSGGLMYVYPVSANNSLSERAGTIIFESSTGKQKKYDIKQNGSPIQVSPTEITIGRKETYVYKKITVTKTGQKSYSSSITVGSSWLSMRNVTGGVEVCARSENTGEQRIGELTITYDDENFVVAITQVGADFILDNDEVTIGGVSGATATIGATLYGDVTDLNFEVPSTCTWLNTPTYSNGKITFTTSSDNTTTSDKTADIKVYTDNDEKTVSITQHRQMNVSSTSVGAKGNITLDAPSPSEVTFVVKDAAGVEHAGDVVLYSDAQRKNQYSSPIAFTSTSKTYDSKNVYFTNSTTSIRYVHFTCEGVTKTVTVAGKSFTLSKYETTVGAVAGNTINDITAEIAAGKTFTFTPSADWVSATYEGGKIVVKAEKRANTKSTRTATITVNTSGGAEEDAETITVTQSAYSGSFYVSSDKLTWTYSGNKYTASLNMSAGGKNVTLESADGVTVNRGSGTGSAWSQGSQKRVDNGKSVNFTVTSNPGTTVKTLTFSCEVSTGKTETIEIKISK